MTQEDKQLLLTDLCGRLPYGVKYCRDSWNYEWDQEMSVVEVLEDIDKEGYINYHKVYKVCDIKPYLRPMESMTDEERAKINKIFADIRLRGSETFVKSDPYENVVYIYQNEMNEYFDFLNKKMFDHRGLIEKGLAIEAPKDMYGKEEGE